MVGLLVWHCAGGWGEKFPKSWAVQRQVESMATTRRSSMICVVAMMAPTTPFLPGPTFFGYIATPAAQEAT